MGRIHLPCQLHVLFLLLDNVSEKSLQFVILIVPRRKYLKTRSHHLHTSTVNITKPNFHQQHQEYSLQCIGCLELIPKQGIHRCHTPPWHCNGASHASPYCPLRPNVTSSIKPEVHNVSQRRQRRTKPRPQGICIQNSVKISAAVPETCSRTDRHTDRQTDIQTS